MAQFMPMKSVRYFALCLGLLGVACAADNSVSPWSGEYFYEAYGGRTAGGSAIIVEVLLTIKKNGSCLLHADGFQRLDRIVCTTSEKGNKLDIKFKSYDGYDFARYKVGELLFVLEKVQGKDKKIRYVQHWASFSAFDDVSKVKEYFKKIK